MATKDIENFISFIKRTMQENDVKTVEKIIRNFSENMKLNENLDELEFKFKDLEEKIDTTLGELRRKFI